MLCETAIPAVALSIIIQSLGLVENNVLPSLGPVAFPHSLGRVGTYKAQWSIKEVGGQSAHRIHLSGDHSGTPKSDPEQHRRSLACFGSLGEDRA